MTGITRNQKTVALVAAAGVVLAFVVALLLTGNSADQLPDRRPPELPAQQENSDTPQMPPVVAAEGPDIDNSTRSTPFREFQLSVASTPDGSPVLIYSVETVELLRSAVTESSDDSVDNTSEQEFVAKHSRSDTTTVSNGVWQTKVQTDVIGLVVRVTAHDHLTSLFAIDCRGESLRVVDDYFKWTRPLPRKLRQRLSRLHRHSRVDGIDVPVAYFSPPKSGVSKTTSGFVLRCDIAKLIGIRVEVLNQYGGPAHDALSSLNARCTVSSAPPELESGTLPSEEARYSLNLRRHSSERHVWLGRGVAGALVELGARTRSAYSLASETHPFTLDTAEVCVQVHVEGPPIMYVVALDALTGERIRDLAVGGDRPLNTPAGSSAPVVPSAYSPGNRVAPPNIPVYAPGYVTQYLAFQESTWENPVVVRMEQCPLVFTGVIRVEDGELRPEDFRVYVESTTASFVQDARGESTRSVQRYLQSVADDGTFTVRMEAEGIVRVNSARYVVDPPNVAVGKYPASMSNVKRSRKSVEFQEFVARPKSEARVWLRGSDSNNAFDASHIEVYAVAHTNAGMQFGMTVPFYALRYRQVSEGIEPPVGNVLATGYFRGFLPAGTYSFRVYDRELNTLACESAPINVGVTDVIVDSGLPFQQWRWRVRDHTNGLLRANALAYSELPTLNAAGPIDTAISVATREYARRKERDASLTDSNSAGDSSSSQRSWESTYLRRTSGTLVGKFSGVDWLDLSAPKLPIEWWTLGVRGAALRLDFDHAAMTVNVVRPESMGAVEISVTLRTRDASASPAEHSSILQDIHSHGYALMIIIRERQAGDDARIIGSSDVIAVFEKPFVDERQYVLPSLPPGSYLLSFRLAPPRGIPDSELGIACTGSEFVEVKPGEAVSCLATLALVRKRALVRGSAGDSSEDEPE